MSEQFRFVVGPTSAIPARHWALRLDNFPLLQNHKTVTAYFSSAQLLPFVIALHPQMQDMNKCRFAAGPASIYNAGPTLNQHWLNILCVLAVLADPSGSQSCWTTPIKSGRNAGPQNVCLFSSEIAPISSAPYARFDDGLSRWFFTGLDAPSGFRRLALVVSPNQRQVARPYRWQGALHSRLDLLCSS